MRDLHIPPHPLIPARIIYTRFARASGKGGQHVNKTSTKVDVRLPLSELSSVWDERLVDKLASQIEPRFLVDDEVRVVCEDSRHQSENLETALVRLEFLIGEALKPRKRRRKSKVPARQKAKRLQDKVRVAKLKQTRRKGDGD
jgi:ribosome-associated protein